MFMLLGVMVGIIVGLIGAFYEWGPLKTGIVAFVSSVILCYVLAVSTGSAGSAATAHQALVINTIRLPTGSGSVVVAPSGRRYVLTNWHVCLGSRHKGKIHASYTDGTTIEGRIVKQSVSYDLCAAAVDSGSSGIRVGRELTKSEPIYTRGYPYGVLSESAGRLDHTERWTAQFPVEELSPCAPGMQELRDATDNIKGCATQFISNVTSLYARPGSSGSPVVNNSGQLVGVVSSWMSDEQNDAGIVRIEDVKEFLKDL